MTRDFGSDSAVPSSDGEAPTRIVSVDAVGRGMLLAGKYEVERVLGQGGMGVVVAAKNTADGGRVALKFLINDAAKDPEAVERFQREARAASQIPNEHVTRVIDTGYLDSGAPFIVMELLQGRDLGQILDESKRLAISTAVDYVLQALEAIGAAHLIGIVHRDIKPANLFLTQDANGQPLVKVLDFGLSKDLGSREGFSLTQTSTGAMGTPLYMAPEQVKSAKHATFASDIWSMGVVIHELVSGDIPFDGANLGALLGAILAEPPKPLRVSLPSVPPGLEAAVLRCLEKDQRKRPRDVLDLARSLVPFASPTGVRSAENIRAAYEKAGWSSTVEGRTTLQSGAVEANLPSDGPRARQKWAFSSDPARQRRRSAVAATVVVAVALIVAGLVVRTRLDAAQVAPTPAYSAETPPSTPAAAPTSSVVVAPVTSAEPAVPSVTPSAAASAPASASGAPAAEDPSAKPAKPRASGGSKSAPPPPAPPPKPSAGSPSLEELLKRGRR
jgi:serine/threonine protein kinase